jgi:hypothetical protein
VFRHRLPASAFPSEHARCSIRESLPEFRTRFHRKTYNGVLELGRVGFCLAARREFNFSEQTTAKLAFITSWKKRVNRTLGGWITVLRLDQFAYFKCSTRNRSDKLRVYPKT